MQLSDVQALKLWRGVVLEQVRDDLPDLSLRQMAVLLSIYLDPPPHTVRGLAAKLGVTKPVITRALNAMSRYKLVERRRDEHDKRNVLVHRTLEGALYLEALAEMIREQAARVEQEDMLATYDAREAEDGHDGHEEAGAPERNVLTRGNLPGMKADVAPSSEACRQDGARALPPEEETRARKAQDTAEEPMQKGHADALR